MVGEGELKTELPDKMTGKDLVVQETYEEGLNKKLFNDMDRVDRRDKRDHIVSMVLSDIGRENYDLINWER